MTGGEDAEQRRFGDYLSHDERYAQDRRVPRHRPRRVERDARTTSTGAHYKVEGATVMARPDPVPTVYFGGSSAAAGPVAARYVDVYLTWGEPPEAVAQKIAWMRELADQAGRTLRFGIRLHTISRDTAKEAWAEANRMLAELSPEEIATSQQALAKSVSVGQQNMRGLHEAYRDGGKARTWRSTPTCGPGSAWSAVAPGPRWSAATPRWLTASRSTRPSASTSSSCPATRTWKRRTGSARASCPSCAAAARTAGAGRPVRPARTAGRRRGVADPRLTGCAGRASTSRPARPWPVRLPAPEIGPGPFP